MSDDKFALSVLLGIFGVPLDWPVTPTRDEWLAKNALVVQKAPRMAAEATRRFELSVNNKRNGIFELLRG